MSFDDLEKWRVPPERVKLGKPEVATSSKLRVRRNTESFYYCPTEWADRAAVELRSSGQLIIALRIFRRWRLRKPGDDWIVASNVALDGPGFHREKKRLVISRLRSAGLINVVHSGPGRAVRLRVIEQVSVQHGRKLSG